MEPERTRREPMKRYRAGLAVLAAATALLSGCINQGPMDQLRTTMAAMIIPTELQPAKLSPWKNFDWASLEMDDGTRALTWEGPRGIDNDTAWMLSGWTVATETGIGDTAHQACEVLMTVAEENAPELDPEEAAVTLNRCQNKRWPTGRTFGVAWHTTTDQVPIKATATLRRTPSDSYNLSLHLTER